MRDRLVEAGIRCHLDDRNDTLNYRIRDGELMKVPFMAVVGQRELDACTVAVRVRGAGRKQDVMPVDAFIDRVLHQIRTRSLDPMDSG